MPMCYFAVFYFFFKYYIPGSWYKALNQFKGYLKSIKQKIYVYAQKLFKAHKKYEKTFKYFLRKMKV